MQISIKSDLKKARRQLKKYPKKVKFASKNAINDTLYDVSRAENKATKGNLDRPVPFTQRLTTVLKAHTSNLTGKVIIPDRKNEYMSYHVHGGTERPSGSAHAVPVQANSRLNTYGNLPRGQRPGALLANSKKFFSGKAKGHKQTAGVWERMGRGGRQRLRLRNVYKRSLTYAKRFPFFEIAMKVVRRRLSKHIDANIKKELRSIR